MGTRGCWGFRIDGQDKLTYNHFDSYPDGLGRDLVQALRGCKSVEDLKSQARLVRLVDQDVRPTAEQIAALLPAVDLSVSTRRTDDWYCLTRSLQGDLSATLNYGYMIDSHKFMGISLFCEWAYVVNLDDGVFEVYRGFQKAKHTAGRYADLPEDRGYFPVALVKTFPLDDLPAEFGDGLFREEGEEGEVE